MLKMKFGKHIMNKSYVHAGAEIIYLDLIGTMNMKGMNIMEKALQQKTSMKKKMKDNGVIMLMIIVKEMKIVMIVLIGIELIQYVNQMMMKLAIMQMKLKMIINLTHMKIILFIAVTIVKDVHYIKYITQRQKKKDLKKN